MKAYFKGKMKQENKYKSNMDNTSASTIYWSTANTIKEDELAYLGDEIQEYIQQITQQQENVPSSTTHIKPAIMPAANSASSIPEMMTKMLERTEALVTSMCNNNNINNNNNTNTPGTGNGSVSGDKKREHVTYDPTVLFKKHQNMGVYCYSCGLFPVDKTHISLLCEFRCKNHNENATWTNSGTGRNMLWLINEGERGC